MVFVNNNKKSHEKIYVLALANQTQPKSLAHYCCVYLPVMYAFSGVYKESGVPRDSCARDKTAGVQNPVVLPSELRDLFTFGHTPQQTALSVALTYAVHL